MKTDRERAHPRRWVICGPPGSGKSTWVNAQRRAGDLVWDADAIAAVLAQCPDYPRPSHVIGVVLELRDVLIRRLAANPLLSCYVIITDVNEAARVAARLGASVKMLESGPVLV